MEWEDNTEIRAKYWRNKRLFLSEDGDEVKCHVSEAARHEPILMSLAKRMADYKKTNNKATLTVPVIPKLLPETLHCNEHALVPL